MGDGRGDCVRCGGKNKWIKARLLCESCYRELRILGRLEEFPTLNRRRRKMHGHCQCFNPIPERFGLYDITQCKKCGKKVA